MAGYRLSPMAAADLEEIVRYIHERDPRAAAKVQRELRTEIRRIASSPNMGHRRDEISDPLLRFWRVYSYLIAYRPDQRRIEIIRVLNGARHLPSALPPSS